MIIFQLAIRMPLPFNPNPTVFGFITFPLIMWTPLLPSNGLTKTIGVRSVNSLRSTTGVADADGPRDGAVQTPTAVIISITASMTNITTRSPHARGLLSLLRRRKFILAWHNANCPVPVRCGMGKTYSGHFRHGSSLPEMQYTWPCQVVKRVGSISGYLAEATAVTKKLTQVNIKHYRRK